MAIHYGAQDKFMLPLKLTKHRSKHFPNAPYLWVCTVVSDILRSAELHPTDHFTDTHLGNVSSRKLRQTGLPRGKLEFPLCSVTAFNARKIRGIKTPTLRYINLLLKWGRKHKTLLRQNKIKLSVYPCWCPFMFQKWKTSVTGGTDESWLLSTNTLKEPLKKSTVRSKWRTWEQGHMKAFPNISGSLLISQSIISLSL